MLQFALCMACGFQNPAVSPWEKEVVYQIFPRSFRDSNGDRIGDLKGIQSELGYLKELGVTAILINPILKSPMYHSYFATDFFQVDPAYGSNDDFFNLVRAAHRKKLKVILDMEIQYVSEGHPWYTAAQNNPNSREARYLWDDKFFYTSIPLPLYNGITVRAKAVDPFNPDVQKAINDSFRYWALPNGKRNAGVDGFRIDHMMDDFDGQGMKKDMLSLLWRPLESNLRKTSKNLFFIGEQSDWGLGTDLFAKADVDSVFNFALCGAISTRQPAKMAEALDKTQAATPPGKTQFVFLENHDLRRFASEVESDPSLLRTAAVLNLTLKGTPSIYYGQELGMKGKSGKWDSDGNDIPQRLAFPWNRTRSAPGTATWYKGTGPWATDEYSRDGDGISLEEQAKDPASLYSFYKRLIKLRQKTPALRQGKERTVATGNPEVFAFEREWMGRRVIVAANFSKTPQAIRFGDHVAEDLWLGRKVSGEGDIEIAPEGFRILALSPLRK